MELFNQWNKRDPVASALRGEPVHTPVQPSFEYANINQPLEPSTLATETHSEPEQVALETVFVPSAAEEPEIIDMDDFSYDGYQVVRGEFFAHIYEPSITFNRSKIYVNSACLRKMPDVDYVQFLVNSEEKTLIIQPCSEDEKDCLAWCSNQKGKRKPRQITGRIFSAMVVDLMGWNANNRYKMLGKIIRSNDELFLLFDLSASEMYVRTCKEGERPRTSRTPIYPADWKNQFGLPVEEHRKLLQVNIFDGYTVFSVQDKKENPENEMEEAGGASSCQT